MTSSWVRALGSLKLRLFVWIHSGILVGILTGIFTAEFLFGFLPESVLGSCAFLVGYSFRVSKVREDSAAEAYHRVRKVLRVHVSRLVERQ